MLDLCKKSYNQPRQHIKKQRHYFANKGLSSQGYVFSSSQVWMWELEYKESRVPKNWCFWILVLEKTLESPLDYKEIQAVHPKGNQSWIFIGRTDAEAETPILWPPDAMNWLLSKDPDAGKDWRREEKGMGWQSLRWLDGLDRHEFWVSSGSWWWLGKLYVLQSMGSQRVGHDWAIELNWTELNWIIYFRPFWVFISLFEASKACSLFVMFGLLIAVASLVVEHRPLVHRLQSLWCLELVAPKHVVSS